MVDRTYREALADNELVNGTPGVKETQITGLEVFGATTGTPFTDAGLTFNTMKEFVLADADVMLKSVYDLDDDGIVDKSETIDDGAGNSKTAAQVAGHIDTVNIHAPLNDGSTTTSNVWSADKINADISAKADQSAFNAHTSDLNIHRALNDALTNTTTLWSSFKISNEIAPKADQTALDAHTGDLDIHRTLNDGIVTVTNLWSASKINGEIILKADITALNAHTTDTGNPHNTTHAQVSPGDTYTHAQIDLHIPDTSHLTANERAAFDNTPNPATGANPLATQADLAAGNGHVIQDEGIVLPQQPNLNFAGAGVTATNDGGNSATLVTITGGGDVIGPSSANDNRLSLFDGVTGKLIKEGGLVEADIIALPTDDQFSGLTQKLTPASADIILIEDSAAFGEKKRVPWSSIPAGIGEAPNDASRSYFREGTSSAWTKSLKGYGEVTQTTLAISPGETLSVDDGNYIISNLTGAYVLVALNASITAMSATWVLQHNGNNVAFPASFKFSGGTVPSGASGNAWILGLFTNNGGTDWVVTYVEDYTL